MTGNLPIWVTLSLSLATTTEEFCEYANEQGVKAEPTSDGRIQLPHGFLAWIDPVPLQNQGLDTGAAEGDITEGEVCLHISGGTNELDRHAHQQPAEIRRMTASMREGFQAMSTLPGTKPRIISNAALKVERLTGILRALLEDGDTIVFPQAGNLAFPSEEFMARSAEFDDKSYHFPLYCFAKVRSDPDGPYASSRGLFVFALPDSAIALKEGVPPTDSVNAMAEVQREMVAEGWWPEHGATFTTRIGTVRIEHVQDALFLVPLEIGIDPRHVAAARYRYALERCVVQWFGQSTLYRERPPNLMVDHHLMPNGKSFAMTNGLSFTPQKGSTPADENERLELVLFSEELGPWATKWLVWIATMIRSNDGSHPIRPGDRLALQAASNGIAGVVAWPWGHFTPLGQSSPPVHLWCLVPILEEELAAFRAAPTAQRQWREQIIAARNIESLFERWSRVA